MARKQYIGVAGIARNVKKGYVGVENMARKVKKGYVGDENGIARLFLTSSSFQFVGFTNTSGYGSATASKDGNSLYLSASGTAPSGVAIDAGYNLMDANGNQYVVPAGSTITVTLRHEIAAYYNLTCLRLTDMEGNYSYPYRNVNATNQTFTVAEDSYLMFLAEVGFNGSATEYARLWVDSFVINGEKIV